jgi:hypothetical protein
MKRTSVHGARVPVMVCVLLMVLPVACTGSGDEDGDGADVGDRQSEEGSEEGAAVPPAGPGAGPAPGAAAAVRRWRPRPGVAWQWQLTTPVDQRVDVPVYDIDGEENSAAVVRALHARGRKVICYVNAGAAEDFRADYGSFPARVLGRSNGWPGERWLDVRRTDVLAPIMARRFDTCRRKGFDAVEPDLLEGYTNDTGFPLTGAHQLRYNRLIARLVHDRGMSVGLKNDLEQVPQLVRDFDFAVNEQCAQYQECHLLAPFIRAGKAVFHVEYELANARFCPQVKRMRFSSMRKRLNLDAARWPC